MKPIVEKYIGKELFEKELNTFQGNQEYQDVFTAYLDNDLTELAKENDLYEDDTPKSLLLVSLKFIQSYIKCREQGFSQIWSFEYAELEVSFDTKDFVYRCYEKVVSDSKDQAVRDLRTFCEIQNGDTIYSDFLIEEVTNLRKDEKPIEDLAMAYSKNYNAQLEKGNSKIYAYQYAQMMIGDVYDPIFCEDYAYMYDQSIKEGKSQAYAERYAWKYADELIDVKARYGISEDEEAIDFAKDKAKAYINGWEYAMENDLKKKELFIELYENAYLNTLYSDNPNEWNAIEDCKAIALKKTLDKYALRQ